MIPSNRSIFNDSVSLSSPSRPTEPTSARSGISVDGNTVSWPDDGWYEVQSATSFNTMHEGGRSATLPAGRYNIINHTTGERTDDVPVGPQLASVTRADLDRPFGPTDTLDSVRNPDIDIQNPTNPGSPENPGANGLLTVPPDSIYDLPDAAIGPIMDGLNPRPAPPPPSTSTLSVFGEGTSGETHVITTSSPDTSAPTSNQPFTNQTQVINPTGVLLTETTVTTPTGLTVRPAGSNGVGLRGDGDSAYEPVTSETVTSTTVSTPDTTSTNSPTTNVTTTTDTDDVETTQTTVTTPTGLTIGETGTNGVTTAQGSRTTSGNENSDYDSNGNNNNSGGGNTGGGGQTVDRTSEPGGMGGV